jgi:hypothetical protein
MWWRHMACCLSIMSYLQHNHDVALYSKSPPFGQFIHQTGNLFSTECAMITGEVSNDCVSTCKPLINSVMHYFGLKKWKDCLVACLLLVLTSMSFFFQLNVLYYNEVFVNSHRVFLSVFSLKPQCVPMQLRRERIAERMRALQELVPNTNKVIIHATIPDAILARLTCLPICHGIFSKWSRLMMP